MDCADDQASKDKGRACAQELTARREIQLHICVKWECSAPSAGGAGEGRGRGSTEEGAGFLEEVMFELVLKERVSVSNYSVGSDDSKHLLRTYMPGSIPRRLLLFKIVL